MNEFTEKLGEIVTAGMSHTHEAQRRMWAASDEVARLKRDLSAAEERQAAAEHEYEQSRMLTMESWATLRDEIVKGRSGDSASPSPQDADSGVPDLASVGMSEA